MEDNTLKNKECLWKFNCPISETEILEGTFKATKDIIENIIGREVILSGKYRKHRKIIKRVDKQYIQLITDDMTKVAELEETGYNPLKYLVLQCIECGCRWDLNEFDLENNLCIYCKEELGYERNKIMFNLEELEIIKDILKEAEADSREYFHSKETINFIIDKINNIIKNDYQYNDCLWEFFYCVDKSKTLKGIFKAPREVVRKIIDKETCFDGVSEENENLLGILKEEYIKLISDDPIIAKNAVTSGFNPLDHLRLFCRECGSIYKMHEYDLGKDLCVYCREELNQDND